MITNTFSRRTYLLIIAAIIVAIASVFVINRYVKERADAEVATHIDAVLTPMFNPKEPGAAVIVVKDGRTVFRKAFGLADIEKNIPLQPDSVFRIGSITKQFTAVAILMLAEQGKLNVDDHLDKFLTGFPTAWNAITIENLLTHTSGIPKGVPPSPGDTLNSNLSVAQMIDTIKGKQLLFDPGQQWVYSNFGYHLLGAIIEKTSGMSYAEYVAKNIFEPVGMANTTFEGYERGGAKRIQGYTRSDSGLAPAVGLTPAWAYSAGALVSNVDDLAVWDKAISQGKILNQASWKKALTPYILKNGKSTNYGYGWMLDKLQGVDSISHSGTVQGFTSQNLWLPKNNVVVVVLENRFESEANPIYVAQKAAGIAIGKPFPEPKEIALDTKLFDLYVGDYQISEKFKVSVSRDGDKFFVYTNGDRRSKFAIFPESETKFFSKIDVSEIQFVKDPDGQVLKMTIALPGRALQTGLKTK